MRLTIAAALAAFAAGAAGAPIPVGAVLWLRPEELSTGSLSSWTNAVTGAAGAVVDSSSCYPSSPTCASAPQIVTSATGSFVSFNSPGRMGLGTNLIVAGNYSEPGTEYSVFYVSAAVSQRLLAARDSNWLLGTWFDGLANQTSRDRAYANDALGDLGWMAQGTQEADGVWRVYGMTIAADGGGTGTGCAWSNTTIIGCAPAVGPDVLRLGGGIGNNAGPQPAEFGRGTIAEVIAWDRALRPEEVYGLNAYFAAKYAGVLGTVAAVAAP